MFGTLASRTPVYAYHDHLGTPRRWRLGNKSIARTYEYDPYGNIYAGSGIFTTIPRIYALHEFDMGLQQYRAPFRHYRPTMARWTTLDPLGMVDGPNMYGYVGANPVYSFDPLGLEACCKSELHARTGLCIAAAGALATCATSSIACTACAVACIKVPLLCAGCLKICSAAAAACVAAAAAVELCLSASEAYNRCVQEASSDPCCAESGGS